MQRTVLALIAALVLAAIVYVLSRPSDGGSPEDPWGTAAPVTTAAAAPAAASAAREAATAAQRVALPADPTEPGAVDAEPAAPVGVAPAGVDDLEIAVRDAAGQPLAGVPVGVRADGATSWIGWRAVTAGRDGVARIADGRTLLAKATGAELSYAAVFAFPLVAGPQVQLDPHALPPDPVVLVMPPVGAVAVVLDDAIGIADADLSIELRAPQDLLRGAAFVVSATEHPHEGLARFERVGLGQAWRVVVRRSGQNRQVAVDFDGPRLPGQEIVVHVALQGTDAVPQLVVQVLDENGEPLAEERIRVEMSVRHGGGSTSSMFSQATDRQGMLRLSLDSDRGETAERQLVLVDAGARPRTAKVAVPDVLHGGDNDLGAVRLLPPAVLCTGVVLGPNGAPSAGAKVDILLQYRQGESTYWDTVRGLRGVTTAADGRFEARGDAADGQLGISVTADGCLPHGPEPFERGADLGIVLAAAATVTGTVLLGEVVRVHDVVVELSVSASGAAPVRDETLSPEGMRGAFTFTGLPSGTATVVVRTLGEAEGLRFDNVSLRPGETTVDPRLQDIDLASGRRVVHFTVVGAADRSPVGNARAVVVPIDAAATTFEGVLLDHGKGRVVTARTSLSLFVFGDGHRTVRVDNVFDGQTIVLPEPLTVRLRLPDDCRVPDASWQLEASLEPRGGVAPNGTTYLLRRGLSHTESGSGDAPWRSTASGEVDANGDAVLRPRWSGPATAIWRLRHGQRSTSVGANVPVELADVAAEQVLRAGITAADLAAAAASLR